MSTRDDMILHVRTLKIPQNTIKTNRWIQQCCKISCKHIKISCLSIHWQMKNRKEFKKISFSII